MVNSAIPKRHRLLNGNLSVKWEIPLYKVLVVEASEASKMIGDIGIAHHYNMTTPCYLKTPITLHVGDKEINLNWPGTSLSDG